jgi:hypothetical protein
MLAEKELQGRQLMKTKNFFTPRSASMAPSRTATPSGARSSMTNSDSHPRSTSSTPSTIAHRTTDPSKASILQGTEVAKTSSSTVPIGRTSDIKYHHFHSIGHFQRDCPSKKSYIATADEGHVSASDTEDDLALQTNHAGDLANDDDDEQVFGSEHMAEYSTRPISYSRSWVPMWIILRSFNDITYSRFSSASKIVTFTPSLMEEVATI